MYQEHGGLLYILVGPPGVGKNTLMNHVLKQFDDIRQLPTATTRAMRPTEQEGREHFFISLDQFQYMLDHDELAEWQRIHNGHYYGTPRQTLEQAIRENRDHIADIDILGAINLHSLYPNNTILIFIQPPSTDVLVERMQQRAESAEAIMGRMGRVEMEMQHFHHCQYLIINDDFDRAADQLRAIIIAEHCRRAMLNFRANHVQLEQA